MRELFDDFNDIELDDNEIIERLMREMEDEERRQQASGHSGPGKRRRFEFVDRDNGDEDYDDFDDDDSDDEGLEDYDDYDEDRY